MRKFFKITAILAILFALGISLRLHQVQRQIKNWPVNVTDLSESGYTPVGVFGHGNLEIASGSPGWIIYDEPTGEGLVRKICTFGALPPDTADVDFIFVSGAWHKLRSGTFVIDGDAGFAEPSHFTSKGFIRTHAAFPVRKPGLIYSLKILRDKIFKGAMSPREYVALLKRDNPSCTDIPAP